MKIIFKNENWKPCLVLFFHMKIITRLKKVDPKSYTLFNSHIEISILSTIMIFREKKLTLSHPPFSQLNHCKHN